MPRQYPTGFRDEMVRRTLAGEPVPTVCSDTGIPEQTLHRWKHQALVDVGLSEGIDSTESAALRAAHKRIRSLEKELQLVKDASEIYDSLAGGGPKRRQAVAVDVVSRGHAARSATRLFACFFGRKLNYFSRH